MPAAVPSQDLELMLSVSIQNLNVSWKGKGRGDISGIVGYFVQNAGFQSQFVSKYLKLCEIAQRCKGWKARKVINVLVFQTGNSFFIADFQMFTNLTFFKQVHLRHPLAHWASVTSQRTPAGCRGNHLRRRAVPRSPAMSQSARKSASLTGSLCPLTARSESTPTKILDYYVTCILVSYCGQ